MTVWIDGQLYGFKGPYMVPLSMAPPISRIQIAVARHFGIPVSEMSSQCRRRLIARPRQVAMYLSRFLTSKSLPEIGHRFGNRDHSTVMHAIRQVEHLRLIDGEFAADVLALEERLA